MADKRWSETAKDAAQAVRGALALLEGLAGGPAYTDVQRRAAMAALRRASAELDVYILRLPA